MWQNLAQVYRNRWRLTPAEKKAQGFNPTADFKHIIYASAGPGWDNTKTKAGRQSHWDKHGNLKANHRDSLIEYLNSSPDSSKCRAMMSSFRQSINVYSGRVEDDTGGATFYIHYWYPAPPWGGSQPNLSNPFSFKVVPFLTYIGPAVSYGGGYYVSAWFYKPADSYFHAGN